MQFFFQAKRILTEHRRQNSIPDILVEPCIALLHTGFRNFIPLRTQLIEKVAKIEYLYNSKCSFFNKVERRDIYTYI